MSDDVLNLLISDGFKTNYLNTYNLNDFNYDKVYSPNFVEENFFKQKNLLPNIELDNAGILESDKSKTFNFEFFQNKFEHFDPDKLKEKKFSEFNFMDSSQMNNSFKKEFYYNKTNQSDPFISNFELPKSIFKYDESIYNEIFFKQIK